MINSQQVMTVSKKLQKRLSNSKYKYNQALIEELFNELANTIGSSKILNRDFIETTEFVSQAFDVYEGRKVPEQSKFVFAVPTRVTRSSIDYWDEVHHFLPLLRHLNTELAYSLLSCIPPAFVEGYKVKDKLYFGQLVFTPILAHMPHDISKLRLRHVVKGRLSDTSKLAARCGAEYIGIGATLPKISNYGQHFGGKKIITTGHAGTVCLIVKTFHDTLNNSSSVSTIGIVGGGSIGRATLNQLTSLYPKFHYIVFDKRPRVNKEIIMSHSSDRVSIAESNGDLIKRSDIIISAVTSPISIEDHIDLIDKVIIDDSQPASFDRSEVLSKNGKLVWVVGSTKKEGIKIERIGSYNYGRHGLASNTDLWGCEAEVASIAYLNRPDLSVAREVCNNDVENIEELFIEMGIQPAKSQSFGYLNG